MEKCSFATRFKELYKEKQLTQQDVADKLGCSVDTIKRYLRTPAPERKAAMPPVDMLRNMATLFEVDTGYLLGEQPCRHWQARSACEETHLSEKSVEILRDLDPINTIALNCLLETMEFKDYLAMLANNGLNMAYKYSNPNKYKSLYQALLRKAADEITDNHPHIEDQILDTTIHCFLRIQNLEAIYRCYNFIENYNRIHSEIFVRFADDVIYWQVMRCEELYSKFLKHREDECFKLSGIKRVNSILDYVEDPYDGFKTWAKQFDPMIEQHSQYIQRQEDGSLLFTCDELRP